MNAYLFQSLLAEFSVESILKLLRSPHYTEVYNALMIGLLAAIGIGLSVGCARLTKLFTSGATPNPHKLFVQLCRAHELSSGERRQLEHLASLLGLSTPSILIIDAGLWQLDELTSEKKLQPKERERLLTLQKTLYDQPRLSVTR